MPTISTGPGIDTFINVLTVAPEHRQELVDLLVRMAEEVTSRQPGYLSTTLHVNPDGTRVTSYVQWRSRQDFEAMLSNPAAQASMQAVRRLATPDAHHYEVVWAHEAPGG